VICNSSPVAALAAAAALYIGTTHVGKSPNQNKSKLVGRNDNKCDPTDLISQHFWVEKKICSCHLADSMPI
jgi:hypothetical protein